MVEKNESGFKIKDMENTNCIKNIQAYQAANLSNEEIISQFIIRENEFETISSEIWRDKMDSSIQHYILIGRRGSGKSTLLRRIQAEVETNNKLNNRLVVVYLSEEQAGIYRLFDLCEAIINEMKVKGFAISISDWTEYESDLSAYTHHLYLQIQQALISGKKKLIVLLDNIDRIFDNIGEDAHLLREWLTNYKDLRIIGGSTRMTEHYWKYDMPFYQFFRIIRLEKLSGSEIRELLIYWGKCLQKPEIERFVNMNPSKIESIRILTDGLPRTLLHFLEVLIDRSEDKGFEYLKMIMDKATPLYQERLNKLSPQQRKILIELSFFWDAVKVNELVDKCKMSGNTISSQLNYLVKNEIVEKVKGLKKDNLYRIYERFFNLWLIMTQGGMKEQRSVKFFTIFLEKWYKRKKLLVIESEPDLAALGHEDYFDSGNYFKEAENDYDTLAEKEGDAEMRNLALQYYSQNKNQAEAVELISKLVESNKDDNFLETYLITMIWAGQIEKFEAHFDEYFRQLFDNQNIDVLQVLFTHLIIHKQYNLCWGLFTSEQYGEKLKEMIRPLYYISAEFAGENEEELLKPAEEQKEIINQLRDSIVKWQKFYYGS